MKDEKYTEASKRMMADLKKIAEDKGMTYETISENSGFIVSNVKRMLEGKYSPDLDNFLKLADAIGVFVDLQSFHK